MNDAGVEVMTNTRVEEVIDRGVGVIDGSGNKSTVAADTVVLALGLTPYNELSASLKGKMPEIHAIGDCVAPRHVFDAMREGFRLARII